MYISRLTTVTDRCRGPRSPIVAIVLTGGRHEKNNYRQNKSVVVVAVAATGGAPLLPSPSSLSQSYRCTPYHNRARDSLTQIARVPNRHIGTRSRTHCGGKTLCTRWVYDGCFRVGGSPSLFEDKSAIVNFFSLCFFTSTLYYYIHTLSLCMCVRVFIHAGASNIIMMDLSFFNRAISRIYRPAFHPFGIIILYFVIVIIYTVRVPIYMYIAAYNIVV